MHNNIKFFIIENKVSGKKMYKCADMQVFHESLIGNYNMYSNKCKSVEIINKTQ